MKKIAAVYGRVSPRPRSKSETIESQIDSTKQSALKENYEVPEKLIFADKDFSGKMLQRPALDDLRDIIRLEAVDAIFVYSPDRLSRVHAHQMILLEEFRKLNIKVYFCNDGPDRRDTAEGRLLTNMQGIIAEYERELIMDRTRRGRLFKAKNGDPSVLPGIPFGYVRVKKSFVTTIECVKENVDIVKTIFRLYVIEKFSLEAIAKHLTENGIRTAKGNSRWDRSTIRDILRNPAYTGTSYYGKTERSEGVSKQIRHLKTGKIVKPKYARKVLPEEKWIPISIPPIIGENDFELAQAQLKINILHAARNTKEPGLLQGLVICGECGYPFYKRSRKQNGMLKSNYHCRSKVDKKLKKCSNSCMNQNELDTLVYNEVMKLIKNPLIIHEELSRRASEKSNNAETEKKKDNLKKERSKILQERDRLLDGYQKGLINLKELSSRQIVLDDRSKECDNQLKSLEAYKFQQELGVDLRVSLESILKGMQSKAEELSLDQKQKLVRLFVEKVVITRENIKIEHCITPKTFLEEKSQLCLGDLYRTYGA